MFGVDGGCRLDRPDTVTSNQNNVWIRVLHMPCGGRAYLSDGAEHRAVEVHLASLGRGDATDDGGAVVNSLLRVEGTLGEAAFD